MQLLLTLPLYLYTKYYKMTNLTSMIQKLHPLVNYLHKNPNISSSHCFEIKFLVVSNYYQENIYNPFYYHYYLYNQLFLPLSRFFIVGEPSVFLISFVE